MAYCKLNMKSTTYSRVTRDQARKQDSHLWRYNNDVTEHNNFQLFHLGKIT